MIKNIEDLKIIYGESNGYYFIGQERELLFSVRKAKAGEFKELKKFVKENLKDEVTLSTWTGTELKIDVKGKHPSLDNLEMVAYAISKHLEESNIAQVCSDSGIEGPVEIYQINERISILSKESFMKLEQKEAEFYNKASNKVGGYLGALGGIALMSIVWILVGQLGYIVYVTGIFIAIFAFKGFEKFSGRPTKTDAIILCIMSFVAIFIAEYLSIGVSIYREVGAYGFSFPEVLFEGMPVLLRSTDLLQSLLLNCILGFLAALITGFALAKESFKRVGREHTARALTQHDVEFKINSSENLNFEETNVNDLPNL